jgi:hypothetical protein
MGISRFYHQSVIDILDKWFERKEDPELNGSALTLLRTMHTVIKARLHTETTSHSDLLQFDRRELGSTARFDKLRPIIQFAKPKKELNHEELKESLRRPKAQCMNLDAFKPRANSLNKQRKLDEDLKGIGRITDTFFQECVRQSSYHTIFKGEQKKIPSRYLYDDNNSSMGPGCMIPD